MHDIFLAEKISQAVIGLCKEKNIAVLSELAIGVYQNSHMTGEQLAEMIKEKNQELSEKRH